MAKNHVIRIQCQDQKGLIAKISGILFEHKHNVLLMKEFVDLKTNSFFARLELSGELHTKKIIKELQSVLPAGADIEIIPKQKKRLIILASKEHHCLTDLLIRFHFGELHANILSVISNHTILSEICSRFEIPFHFISHDLRSKIEFETELMGNIADYQPDLIVLAKFMRILSPGFVHQFKDKIINIHHSFLPAFIGAHPYKQAFERGVKIIGATAHFVNDTLDDGPIISQKTIEVDHEYELTDLIESGHEIEKAVLADALHKVLADKVFISNNKTIILD
ncbi:MAG: formyltetrahydrofolate deformylase [Saprospiraceae bacterium]